MALKRTSRQTDPARKIEDLLKTLEEKIDENIKFTVGDYIRLLQARQEFDRETPRDIEVTWVDSLAKKSEPEQ